MGRRYSEPVATKPKRPASYDLKAADRKRNLAIQIGLTSVVVIFAVALVRYIVMSNEKKPASGEAKSIRVASSKLIKKEGSSDPKAVLSLYEDFLCPHCGKFEQQFGPTIRKLISPVRSPPITTWSPSWIARATDTRRGPQTPRIAWPTKTRKRSSASTMRSLPQQPEEGAGRIPR